MNTNTLIMWGAVLVVVLTGGWWIMSAQSSNSTMATTTSSMVTNSTETSATTGTKVTPSKVTVPAKKPTTNTGSGTLAKDFKSGTYTIDGKSVTLVNGAAVSGGVTTKVFGNEAVGDLNSDSITDVAFLVTQDGGGSGTFYYLVAATKSNNGYRGTNGILIGDRIAPQPTDIDKGEIIVNYADRLPGQPMSATPTIQASKYFHLVTGKLLQIQ